MSRKYKKSLISQFFSGIFKLVFGFIGVIIVSFIIVSGDLSINLSFNKAKSEPVSLIEKAGKSIALVKKGYDTVNDFVR